MILYFSSNGGGRQEVEELVPNRQAVMLSYHEIKTGRAGQHLRFQRILQGRKNDSLLHRGSRSGKASAQTGR